MVRFWTLFRHINIPCVELYCKICDEAKAESSYHSPQDAAVDHRSEWCWKKKTPPPWMAKMKSSSALIISSALDGVVTRNAGSEREQFGFEGISHRVD